MEPVTDWFSGKWVLCGEHTVVRGGRAIVLPASKFRLRIYPGSEAKSDLVVSELLASLENILDRDDDGVPSLVSNMPESFRIESNIPTSAGLGSSAALCAAVVTLRLGSAWVRANFIKALEYARRLEDQFHGTSSGMDVACSLSGNPLLYERGREPLILPSISGLSVDFFDTGLRAQTADVVKLVGHSKNLLEGDRLMREVVENTLLVLNKATHQSSHPHSEVILNDKDLRELARGMNESMNVYRLWGIVPSEVETQVLALKEKGYLGVRLTGKGMGGFLVAMKA